MTRPSGGDRRPPGVWDRIMASRHRRSILGSLAVLALLVVVIVAGLVGGDGRGGSALRGPAVQSATADAVVLPGFRSPILASAR